MQRSWLRPRLRHLRSMVALATLCGLAACATAPPATRIASAGGGRTPAYNRPYQIHGRWYVPASQPHYDVVGVASWYSYESHNRTTADGEPFNARLAAAAHTTLPLPSYLEVTNLDNGRRIRVRLNDRGPFVSGRLIDLTRGAAEELGYVGRGTARVRVRYLGPAPAYGRGDVSLSQADGTPIDDSDVVSAMGQLAQAPPTVAPTSSFPSGPEPQP